jgi:hypothetical protein
LASRFIRGDIFGEKKRKVFCSNFEEKKRLENAAVWLDILQNFNLGLVYNND